jgi:hypothetical protein
MIIPGTILMAADVLHPQWFQLGDDSHPNGWRTVRHDLNPHDFEQELASGGWAFFYIASPVTTTKFGFDRAKMMNSALRRLIKDTRLQRCNCLEIQEVETHSFLGVPYVTVSGHPRNIQKGVVFSGQ